MTLISLRALVQHVKEAIATFDHLLLTDSKHREKYQAQISEAQQHLYQLKFSLEKRQTEVCFLERCFRLKIKPKKHEN